MADILKILCGTGVFILGYFYVTISQYIFPTLIDLLNDTLGGIVWFGVIITWVLAMIVLPLGFKIWGLTTPTENGIGILDLTFGVLWGLFSVVIVYFTWFWNTTLVNMLNYDILIALYWIGLIMVYIFNVIIVPSYIIIQAKRG